ncbi:MAG: hypothetical protein KDA28_01880, partial [Phycisphaerales bacterium]|nr:hypothetical protein [Phycisphaerales bacterium]
RRWESKRSFFLHDLFTEKVFRERGLVTASESPSTAKRKRRLVLYGSTAAMLLVAIGLAVWWLTQLYASLVGPKERWQQIAALVLNDGEPKKIAVLDDDGTYLATRAFTAGEYQNVKPRELPLVAMEATKERISARGIFGLIVKLDNFDAKQRRAHEAIFEASVLRPLVNRARLKLQAEDEWGENEIEILADMLAIHSGIASGMETTRRPRLDRLLAYVVDLEILEAQMRAASEVEEQKETTVSLNEFYRERLQSMFSAMYEEDGAWPPPSLGRWNGAPDAVTTFAAYWERSGGAGQFVALTTLKDAAETWKQKEDAFRNKDGGWFKGVTTVAAFTPELGAWKADLEDLGSASDALKEALDRLDGSSTKKLAEITESIRARTIDDAQSAFTTVLTTLPAPVQDASEDGPAEGVPPTSAPVEMYAYLDGKRTALSKELAGRIETISTGVNDASAGSFEIGSSSRAFLKRMSVYEDTTDALEVTLGAGMTLAQLDSGREHASTSDLTRRAQELVVEEDIGSAIDAANRRWRWLVADRMLAKISSSSKIENLMSELAEDSERDSELVAVPLTLTGAEKANNEVEAGYRIDRLTSFGSVVGWLRFMADATDPTSVILDVRMVKDRLASLADPLDEYAKAASTYWDEEVTRQQTCASQSSWADLDAKLSGVSESGLLASLKAAAEAQSKAMDAIVLISDDESIDDRRSKIATRATLLNNKAFVDEAMKVFRNWVDLPSSAESARTLLVKDTAISDLRAKYLLTSGARTAKDVPFLASLATESMERIGSDVKAKLDSGSTSDLDRFPLNKVAKTGIQDVTGAQDRIRQFLSQSGGGGQTGELTGDYAWA